MAAENTPTDTALLIGLQKDMAFLTQKVEELKGDMKNTYATKDELNLIREWIKPYVDRQKHIEYIVFGGLVLALLKLVILP